MKVQKIGGEGDVRWRYLYIYLWVCFLQMFYLNKIGLVLLLTSRVVSSASNRKGLSFRLLVFKNMSIYSDVIDSIRMVQDFWRGAEGGGVQLY